MSPGFVCYVIAALSFGDNTPSPPAPPPRSPCSGPGSPPRPVPGWAEPPASWTLSRPLRGERGPWGRTLKGLGGTRLGSCLGSRASQARGDPGLCKWQEGLLWSRWHQIKYIFNWNVRSAISCKIRSVGSCIQHVASLTLQEMFCCTESMQYTVLYTAPAIRL